MKAPGSILIQGGRLVDPAAGVDGLYDVRIKDGRVLEVGARLQAAAGEQVVDANGMLVTPGWIDLHVHFREPGFEYKETIETGSRSAVAGGFTTVVAMANTQPVNDNPAITQLMIDRSNDVGLCRVLPVAAATKGLEGAELAEIGQMLAAGAVLVSDDGRPVMSAGVQRKVFEYCKALNVPVSIHAEDLELTAGGSVNEGVYSTQAGLRGMPNAAEEVMVARDIVLAKMTGAHLHVAHVSTAGAVAAVREAKKAGIRVTAEAAPHHLVLTDKEILRYDTNFKMNPPLRAESDRAAVVAGLRDGTVDVMATDHAPHSLSDKEVEFERAPNGIVGLESALPLMFELVRSGEISLGRMIETVTAAPARILGLAGLGTLAPGSAGDAVVINPEEAWIFEKTQTFSKSKNTPFQGRPMIGRVKATIFQGRLVYPS